MNFEWVQQHACDLAEIEPAGEEEDDGADRGDVAMAARYTACRSKIINELCEEGLPVLACFLSSSVRSKESHQQARPMIHLDRNHKVTLEFGALFDELQAAKKRP